MSKIIHVQTVMTEDTLEELKRLTGEHAAKDALSKAADDYITTHKPMAGQQAAAPEAVPK
jgi:hypothetical protein